jgi:hypothetical protein
MDATRIAADGRLDVGRLRVTLSCDEKSETLVIPATVGVQTSFAPERIVT